jgi:hypothetical protein
VKKRGNGEGSVFKRNDGRWCARYTVGTLDGLKRRDIPRKDVAKKLREALNDSHRDNISASGEEPIR